MKKLFTLLTLVAGFAVGSLSAEDFSGTITWTMRVLVTDPALKKQMADAQAQLADPQVQAQLKAAQEAMNSPEMQELLKANPQMKEMLEKQLGAQKKAGAAGDATSELFPKGFTLQLKGPRCLVKTDGGLAPGEVLTFADQNVSYQIDRKARTYRKLPADPLKDTGGNYKVTPTLDTAQVVGYECRRFLVEATDKDEKMTYSIWATEDIKGLDAGSLRRLRFGEASGSEFLSQIKGVPLKIDVLTPHAKMFMVATSVKSETLPDALFALPDGFTEIAAQGR